MLLKMQIFTEAVDGHGIEIVLQGGFWFAFKLTDCSYRFERVWHAVIILFPYGKWLKIPCLCCYLFISSRTNIEALLLQTICCCIVWLSTGSHVTLRMRWGRLLAFLWKGHVENVGVWGILIIYLVRWSNKKKMCHEIFVEGAEYWILKCTGKHRHDKSKATNEFLDWDNWVFWHCVPSL